MEEVVAAQTWQYKSIRTTRLISLQEALVTLQPLFPKGLPYNNLKEYTVSLDMLWVFPRKGVKVSASATTAFVDLFQEGKQVHRVLEKNEAWVQMLSNWFECCPGEELLGEKWLAL